MSKARLCSIPECGTPHFGKGFCSKHYRRLWEYGTLALKYSPRGEAKRFCEEVALPYEGKDCLFWPFSRNLQGYGQLKIDGKTVIAPRYVCKLANGEPPTPDHEAAHSCGNGHLGCISKGHLSWKTHAGNQQDKLIHGTHNRGEKHNMAKLTESQAREILTLKGKESQSSIADRFGVRQSTVSDIQRGRIWGWLQEGSTQ